MLKIIEFFSKPNSPCGYYEDRCAHFRYFFIEGCTQSFCQALIERGFRRFGEYFFTPMCANCKECLSIRQNVRNFSFHKSYKRIFLKNRDTKITLSRPRFSKEKLRLHNEYHKKMEAKKGWKYHEMSPEGYKESFIHGQGDFGYEIMYRVGGKLAGVGYFDALHDGISATYFFYDHAFASRSLGTFNILMQILIAKKQHLSYFYPGYWIKGHHSMGYKERFKPFEVLQNTPDIFDMPIWKIHTYNALQH